MHPSNPSLRRFQVEAELARGGMGAVFAAHDTVRGQRLALKRLNPSAPARAAALFEHEFYVLSSLKHPRIIEDRVVLRRRAAQAAFHRGG